MTRTSKGHAGKAVELSACDVSERVAGQGISRQQDYVEQQDESGDPDPDSSIKKESPERVPPKKDEEDEPYIEKVTMEVLQNKRKCSLTSIAVFAALADGAAGWIKKKCPIISLAVVVAGDPESQRPDQDQ